MLIGFFHFTKTYLVTTTHTYTVLYVLKCAFVVLGFRILCINFLIGTFVILYVCIMQTDASELLNIQYMTS